MPTPSASCGTSGSTVPTGRSDRPVDTTGGNAGGGDSDEAGADAALGLPGGAAGRLGGNTAAGTADAATAGAATDGVVARAAGTACGAEAGAALLAGASAPASEAAGDASIALLDLDGVRGQGRVLGHPAGSAVSSTTAAAVSFDAATAAAGRADDGRAAAAAEAPAAAEGTGVSGVDVAVRAEAVTLPVPPAAR